MDSTRFKLWASLGEMYHQQERPDSVAFCWQQADHLLTTHPTLERETRAYVAAYWGNRGTAWLQQGDYPLAERCFQKRLLLVDRRDPNRVALAENQFATFYLVTHQLSKADSLFGVSLRHYTGSGLERGSSRTAGGPGRRRPQAGAALPVAHAVRLRPGRVRMGQHRRGRDIRLYRVGCQRRLQRPDASQAAKDRQG